MAPFLIPVLTNLLWLPILLCNTPDKVKPIMQIPTPVEAQRPSPSSTSFTFSGSGREYFGIWIVNLLLSVVTLGIYSAWAKVRRLQYFYRNTSLAGSSFDYHGSPMAIFKGRIIGIGLLLAYNLSFKLSVAVGLATAALLAAVMPWLLMRSLRFKLYNSSYRGLRFAFRGSPGESYVVFLILPLVTAFTAYLLGPLWHQQLKKYQHNNSFFGATAFSFDAPLSAFYKIYLAAVGMFFALIVLAGFAAGLAAPGMKSLQGPQGRLLIMLLPLMFFGFFVLLAVLVKPYITARIQNLVWNNTQLGPHRFVSKLSARKLFLIGITNLLAIIATLGLYKPFAVVRLLRYRVESMALLPAANVEDIVAGQAQAVSAAGEETAEMFDIDIAL